MAVARIDVVAIGAVVVTGIGIVVDRSGIRGKKGIRIYLQPKPRRAGHDALQTQGRVPVYICEHTAFGLLSPSFLAPFAGHGISAFVGTPPELKVFVAMAGVE